MSAHPRLSAAILIVTVAACSGAGDTAAVADPTLERDLRLASTSLALTPNAAHLTSLETAPQSGQAETVRPRAARTGPRRVPSSAPTVRAEPTAEAAADVAEGAAEEALQPVAIEGDPGEASADAGVALPRPVPATVGAATGSDGRGEGDYGTGRGSGGIGGGIWGVVLRGGGVGGRDDCEVHGTRGGRQQGPVYRGPGTENAGGIAGGRWPVGDRGQRTASNPRGGGSRGGRWPIGRN